MPRPAPTNDGYPAYANRSVSTGQWKARATSAACMRRGVHKLLFAKKSKFAGQSSSFSSELLSRGQMVLEGGSDLTLCGTGSR